MGAIENFGKLVIFVGGCLGNYQSVEQAFQLNGIVPDVVSYPPRCNLGIFYPTGVRATQGNMLSTSQLKDSPNAMWRSYPNKYYTLILADPDAPSRTTPKERCWLHWMIINIPGTNLRAGETVFDYVPPGPPPNTGLHRYVFLVYEQPSRISYCGPRDFENRGKFHPNQFAAQYGLGCPYAGNFFYTQNEKNKN